MSKQAKRARFYAAQRRAIRIERVHRAYRKVKGYLGATIGLTITLGDGTLVRTGPGALFIGDR